MGRKRGWSQMYESETLISFSGLQVVLDTNRDAMA